MSKKTGRKAAGKKWKQSSDTSGLNPAEQEQAALYLNKVVKYLIVPENAEIPMRKNRKINLYTPEGRAEIHDNLRIDVNSMLWLMRHPISTESVRYNDNRVSLYAGQDGKCAITGKKLDVQTCICYRKTNDCKKGNDSYQNLLLLSLQGLAIVSSEDMMSVVALVKEYSLNAKVITKVNKLRATAGLPLLAAK